MPRTSQALLLTTQKKANPQTGQLVAGGALPAAGALWQAEAGRWVVGGGAGRAGGAAGCDEVFQVNSFAIHQGTALVIYGLAKGVGAGRCHCGSLVSFGYSAVATIHGI